MMVPIKEPFWQRRCKLKKEAGQEVAIFNGVRFVWKWEWGFMGGAINCDDTHVTTSLYNC